MSNSKDELMEWKARPRNYNLERNRLSFLPRDEVENHPLKLQHVLKTTKTIKKENFTKNPTFIKTTNIAFNENKSEFEDPLSKFAAEATHLNEKLNARRQSSNDVLVNNLDNEKISKEEEDDGFESWSQKQSKILSKFTTSQKLSLVTFSNKKEFTTRQLPTSVSEKVRTRLEQLDELEEGSIHETLTLTQEEYVTHINKLGNSMVTAWKDDQRVKTLKISIQCAKFLDDTSSKQFYPSKFVIVTEILDNFGSLVFERLLEKSSSTSNKNILSISNIEPQLISDVAKETCRNWFYKIASIRELLPRIYIEASLLKCLDFLEQGAAECVLERLVAATRGVANPLVATYFKCYLARIGESLLLLRASKKSKSIPNSLPNCGPFAVNNSSHTYLLSSLTDTIDILTSPPFFQQLAQTKTFKDSERITLCYFVPAIEWMIRCLSKSIITHTKNFDPLDVIYDCCNRCKDYNVRSMMTGCLIDHSPSSYVAEKAIDVREMISQLDGNHGDVVDLYLRFGMALSHGSDPPEADRRPLLNDVWRSITAFERPSDYVTCATAWSAYVARHFGRKEVNAVMGDVVKKLTPDRAFETEQGSLKILMEHFMSCCRLPLLEFVVVTNFLPLLDVMEGEAKVSTCKNILMRFSEGVRESRFLEGSTEVRVCDPVIIHTFMTLCKHLYDQATALSVNDEVRFIGHLISNFISTVQKNTDSSQLDFFIECRSTFCNIDPVLMTLVHKVNDLAINRKPSIGIKSKQDRDGSFSRACSAYSFITIPSLNGIFHKLNLNLVSGQVALHNGCIAQADSFFRSALQMVVEVPRLLEIEGKTIHTEGMLLEFLRNFCSGLLVLPDPPDQVPLFHFKELFHQIDAYPWDLQYDTKPLAHCALLSSLSSLSQSRLPYKVQGIDSNDMLYGSDPKFLAEVCKLAVEIMRQIIVYLEASDGCRVTNVAATVFEILIDHLELDSCAKFFKTLWNCLGSGNWKNDANEVPFSNRNSSDSSVSINVTKVIERVKQLAIKDPKYEKFLALMLS